MMYDLTFTSLETITAFNITTGDYMFTLDELQNATIAQSQEKTDVVGKQGRKLNSLKKNKGVKISGANGMISGGLLELQTGCDFENKVTPVLWTDYLTVTTNASATNYKAIGEKGAEIDAIYAKDPKTGGLGKKLTQNATAESTGQFAYDPETKDLTFYAGDFKDGDEIVVFYTRNIKADVQTNSSDVYSKKCSLYIDALAEDKCSNIYHVQFFIPKADFNGEFNIEMGENQTVHNFEAESLAGACGTAGALWTYTVFDDEIADAE